MAKTREQIMETARHAARGAKRLKDHAADRVAGSDAARAAVENVTRIATVVAPLILSRIAERIQPRKSAQDKAKDSASRLAGRMGTQKADCPPAAAGLTSARKGVNAPLLVVGVLSGTALVLVARSFIRYLKTGSLYERPAATLAQGAPVRERRQSRATQPPEATARFHAQNETLVREQVRAYAAAHPETALPGVDDVHSMVREAVHSVAPHRPVEIMSAREIAARAGSAHAYPTPAPATLPSPAPIRPVPLDTSPGSGTPASNAGLTDAGMPRPEYGDATASQVIKPDPSIKVVHTREVSSSGQVTGSNKDTQPIPPGAMDRATLAAGVVTTERSIDVINPVYGDAPRPVDRQGADRENADREAAGRETAGRETVPYEEDPLHEQIPATGVAAETLTAEEASGEAVFVPSQAGEPSSVPSRRRAMDEPVDQAGALAHYLMRFHSMINLLRSRRAAAGASGAPSEARSITVEDSARYQETLADLDDTLAMQDAAGHAKGSQPERIYTLTLKLRDALQNQSYTDDDLLRLHEEIQREACEVLADIPDEATQADAMLVIVRQMWGC